MKKYKIAAAILMAITLASCEKVINVDLKSAAPKIVIEGIINNSDPAKVVISKSIAFSNNSSFPAVTGATVKINDNAGNTYTLSETVAGTYTNALLVGVPGRTYTLAVTAEGKNYTANCTMQPAVTMDTLYQETVTITAKSILATAEFTDPNGFGNSYHFVETVNGKRNKTIFVVDDLFQDGGLISYQLFDEDLKLKAGDVVQVEMQCIDRVIFRYLRGMQDLQFNNTVPANPDNNISNSALGYFSAHTAQKKTIVIR
jgi:Domain of unknown function (DUF4249)